QHAATGPEQGWQPQRLPDVVLEQGTVATSTALTAQGSTSDGVSLLAVPIAPGRSGDGPQPRVGTADAAARYRIDLGELAERLKASGEAGTSVTVPLPRPVSAADT